MTRVTCEEFDEIVHSLVRLELFDVALREAAFHHANSCERCAARVRQAKSLAEISEGLAIASRMEQAPTQLKTALLAAFREHYDVRRVQRRLVLWEAAAAATVLVVAGWVSYRHWKKVPALATHEATRISTPAPATTQAQLPPQVAAEPSAQLEPRQILRRAQPSSATGKFIRVPYAEALNPDEPALVVRVQLTSAALSALGYPVDEADTEHWYSADVLMDQDGWLRAVRVVQ